MYPQYHVYDQKPSNPSGWVIAIVLIILFSMLLFGCSPSKRLQRLLKNHPELLTRKDSVVVRHDTITTKEVHKDSVISNIYSRDTVYLRENHLEVKYVYKGGDSAYIAGVMAPYKIPHRDSVIYRQNIVEKQVIAPLSGFEQFCKYFFIFACIVGLVILIFNLLKAKL